MKFPQNSMGQQRYYIKLILNKYLRSTEKQLLGKQNNQNYKYLIVYCTRTFKYVCRYSREYLHTNVDIQGKKNHRIFFIFRPCSQIRP